MKKNLLVLGALALTSLGAFAQNLWTPPTPPAGSELVPGEKVYLFNKEAGAFLRGLGEGGGPYWGSRAGVAIEGCDTIIFQPAVESSILEGTSPLPGASTVVTWDTEWDGQTYILQNYASHITKPRWDEVWFGLADLNTIWVDRQNDSPNNYNFFWNVVKNANGNYEISVSTKSIGIADPDLYASLTTKDETTGEILSEPAIKGGERIGVSVTDVNGEVRFEGAAEDLSYEWIIVSQETFATLDTAKMKAELALYRAAVDLKKYLDAKSAEYTEVDFAEVAAVYNNTNSTVEELQAAKAKVDALIMAWQAGQATPDNPKVLEGAIQNATFDKIGDFWGWQGTAFGAGGTTSTCAEHFSKVFNTYQDIVTELPVGIYRVAVKGFHRAGVTDNDWNTKDDPASRTAKLYAVSGEDSLYTGIQSLAAAASPSPVEGAAQEVSYAGMYLPNSMADFTVYKEAGLIKEVSVLVPVNNGKLRIGVVKTTNITNDWTIVDDFTLEYYGSTLAAYELYRDQVLASYPTPEEAVADGALYKESYLTAYTEAYNGLAAATDAATISTASTKLAPALDALNANVKAYQDYVAAVATAEEFLGSNGDQLDQEADTVVYLSEYIGGEYAPGEEYPFPNGAYLYITGMEEPGACTLETEQVIAEITYVNTLVTGAAKCTMEGGDVTNLLVNPDFSNGGNGWTTGGKTPEYSWGVAEVFEGAVDISQTITNVKPGIYSISVQAFERPAANGSYDGTEESKVFLYMGDLETPVQNITKDVLPAEMAKDRVNCLLSNDYQWTSADGSISGYVPNGMEGASIAFAAGRYYQECYGIVGDDGIMKIGLTSHGVSAGGGFWVLWDDFKLKFWGKNAEAMTEVLTGKHEIAEEYLGTYGSELSQPAYNALNDALTAAEAAIDSEDYDQMAAALSAISKAQLAANENKTAVAALVSAIDDLDIAVMENEQTASEETLGKAVAMLEELGDEAAIMALTTEEINAKIEEIKIINSLLPYNALYLADLERVPEIPTDPADCPFDMAGYFQNGGFDGTDFWEIATTAQNNQGLGNAREFWNGSADGLTFNVNQTLYALPEGKYVLEAELGNAKNGAFVEANEGRAHLYADVITIGVDTVTTSTPVEPRDADLSDSSLDPYSIEFDVPAHKDGLKVVVGIRTVGTMAARWFAYDNFVLKMLSNPATGIEGVEEKVEAATPVAVYNISGTRINKVSKGINIIKMSDGSVKKVLVK